LSRSFFDEYRRMYRDRVPVPPQMKLSDFLSATLGEMVVHRAGTFYLNKPAAMTSTGAGGGGGGSDSLAADSDGWSGTNGSSNGSAGEFKSSLGDGLGKTEFSRARKPPLASAFSHLPSDAGVDSAPDALSPTSSADAASAVAVAPGSPSRGPSNPVLHEAVGARGNVLSGSKLLAAAASAASASASAVPAESDAESGEGVAEAMAEQLLDSGDERDDPEQDDDQDQDGDEDDARSEASGKQQPKGSAKPGLTPAQKADKARAAAPPPTVGADKLKIEFEELLNQYPNGLVGSQ
jgi:hypothetical protein